MSLDKECIYDMAGNLNGEIALAPPMLAGSIVRELESAPDQPEEERLAALVDAGRIFAEDSVKGETPVEYCNTYARVSGMPIAVAQRSLQDMRQFMTSIQAVVEAQRPTGTVVHYGKIRADHISAVWLPRGKTLTVIAPSNHPMTHVSWLQALAFGYHVALRPGRRDPFTPLRLIRSLLRAGLHPGHIALVPGPHTTAQRLIDTTDLAIVYGSDTTVAHYVNQPKVLVRGPGRCKTFVQQELITDDVLNVLTESIAADGGVRCTNTSAIIVDGDERRLAAMLAERLAQLPLYPVTDPRACLASLPKQEAWKIRTALDDCRGDALDLCLPYYEDGPVTELTDGTVVLRPAVILCHGSDHPSFGMEFPFPCVWVAPYKPAEGIQQFRHSLAVTLVTKDEHLVRAALMEKSIRKVLWGNFPTYHSTPAIPHDGYLGEFLMQAKGFAKRG